MLVKQAVRWQAINLAAHPLAPSGYPDCGLPKLHNLSHSPLKQDNMLLSNGVEPGLPQGTVQGSGG